MSLSSDNQPEEEIKLTCNWNFTDLLDAREGIVDPVTSTPGVISSPLRQPEPQCVENRGTCTQQGIHTQQNLILRDTTAVNEAPSSSDDVKFKSPSASLPADSADGFQTLCSPNSSPEFKSERVSVVDTVSTCSTTPTSTVCPKVVVAKRVTASPGQNCGYLKKNILYKIRRPSQIEPMFAIWNGKSFVQVASNNKEDPTASPTGVAVNSDLVTSAGADLSPGPACSALTSVPSVRTIPIVNNSTLVKYRAIVSALQRENNSQSVKVMNGVICGSQTSQNPPATVRTLTNTMKSSENRSECRPDKLPDEAARLAPDPPPEALAEGEFKLCKHCGGLTKSVRACESCGKTMSMNDKTVRREIQSESAVKGTPWTNQSDSSLSQCSLTKQSFYGHKLHEQWQAYGGSTLQRGKRCGGGVPSNRVSRKPEGKTNRGRPPKRKTKAEPVTVTISSDEEEHLGDQANSSIVSSSSVNSSLTDSAVCGEPETPVNMDTDKCEDTKSNFSTSCEAEHSAISQSPELDQWYSVPDLNCSSMKTRTGTRRDRMEDATGHVPTKTRKTRDRRADDTESWLFTEPSVTLLVRHVRVGTLKGVPVEPVFLSKDGFFIKMECTANSCEFRISPGDIENVAFHLQNRLPVMYLNISVGCSLRLQRELKHCSDEEAFFDPSCSDLTKKFITLLLGKQTDKGDQKNLLSLLQHFQRLKPHRSPFLQTLSYDEAQSVLIRTTKQETVKMPNITNSPTTPKVKGFLNEDCVKTAAEHSATDNCPGSVEKLFTYRPVAEKGGISISTEDLFCLREGEFLNDVIIDFYLKYLMNSVLSEGNRKRAYVFSSFFYKRLTQRQGRSSLDDKQPLDLKFRRHEQVKTWTRHVDLFSKDFIIVPINEHSHWFLAIICFPGMLPKGRPRQLVASAPMTPPSETSPQTQSTESSEEGNGFVTNHLADPLSPSYTQPCILVFDSLAGPARTSVVKTLREYLSVEWSVKKQSERTFDRDTVRGGYPKVPQQTNFSDCGVYVLQFVESFFKTPIKDFSIPIRGLQDWFTEEEVTKKRGQIRDLILSLHQKSKLESRPS